MLDHRKLQNKLDQIDTHWRIAIVVVIWSLVWLTPLGAAILLAAIQTAQIILRTPEDTHRH